MVRLALLSLFGCSTVSQVGTFVADVNVVGDSLLVRSCDVSVTVVNDWVNNSQSEHANASGCTVNRAPLSPVSALVLGSPRGCETEIARWQAATTTGRRRLWPELARTCRAYLEEQR